MIGYNPFWIYESMLEAEYLERMEQEENEFICELKTKTNLELEQLLTEAEEEQSTNMWQLVTNEMNRRLRCEH